ncbi:DUF4259 domain-containing protein [Streptomyces sp. NPDC052012]|uniref:DUF4259 domain-containing protein n=1 Tax=Streptomyces sp. NPDC052012 TaxID=3155051 RepID=UPI00344CE112
MNSSQALTASSPAAGSSLMDTSVTRSVATLAIDVLERAFQRVTSSGARLDGGDGAEAVAAGVLIASTIPDSPISIDPDDGLRGPLPKIPTSLRALARLALDRVLQDGSEMATGWVDSADADQWRREVPRILEALEEPTGH